MKPLRRIPVPILWLVVACTAIVSIVLKNAPKETEPAKTEQAKPHASTKEHVWNVESTELKDRQQEHGTGKQSSKTETLSVDELSKLIQTKQNDADLYNRRGLAYVTLGNYALAMSDLKKAVSLQPLSAKYRVSLADTLFALEQFTAANQEYQIAVHIQAQTPDDLFQRALAYNRLRQLPTALTALDKAVEAGYSSDEVFALRGRIYFGMDRFNEGMEQFEEALKIKKNPKTYLSMARCYRRMNDFKKAQAALQEAKKLDPTLPDIYLQEATYDLILSKPEEAKEAYETWSRLVPKETNIHPTWQSFTFYCEVERKIENYTGIIAISGKTNATPFFERGMLYMLQARYESAAKDMRRYLDATSWAGKGGMNAGNIAYIAYKISGRPKEAAEVRRQAVLMLHKKDWPFPILQFLTGEISETQLKKLADSNDKRIEALYYIALNYVLNNKDPEAIRELEWITKNGDKGLDEYQLAVAECKRLKHRRELKQLL